VEYNSEQGRANRAAAATNKALSELAKSAATLEKSQASLADTVDLTTRASEGSEDAQKKLLEKYPQYATALDGLSVESDEYKDILSLIVQTERRKLAKDTGEGITAALDGQESNNIAAQASSDTKNLSTALIGQSINDAVTRNAKEGLKIDHSEIGTKDYATVVGDGDNAYINIQKFAGMEGSGSKKHPTYTQGEKISIADLKSALAKLGVDTTQLSTVDIVAAAQKAGIVQLGDTWNTQAANLDKRYDSSKYNEIVQHIKDNFATVSSSTPQLGSWYSDFGTWYDLSANGGMGVDTFNKLFAYYNYLYDFGNGNAEAKAAFKAGTGLTWEDYVNTFPDVDGTKITPKLIYDKYNKDAKFDSNYVPKFAVGTNYVPYDNYLALLHKGEQVRTSAEVALENANKHIASSETSKAIHDVLLTQTNTIISILTDIYKVIANRPATGGASTTTKHVYDLPGI
jgi:hypothetical protein